MSFLLKTLLGIGGIVLYKLFSEDQNNHGDGSLDRHGLNRENRDREPVTRTTAPSYEHRSRQPNAETRTGLNRVYENSTPINAPEAAPSYDHRSRQPNAEIGTGVRHGIYENSTPIRAPEPATSYDHPSPQPKAEIRTGFHHELVYKNSTPIKAPEGVKRTPHEVSPPPSSSRVPPSSVKPTLSPAPSSDSTNSEAKTKYVLVQKDVSPIYVIPEDFKDLIKKDIVPGVLKKPLSPSTYRDYFAALLYAEDFYIEKWSNFQLFNVTLELHEAAIYDKPKKNKKFEESDKKDENLCGV